MAARHDKVDQLPRYRAVRLAFLFLIPLLLVVGSAWEGRPLALRLLQTLGVLLVVLGVGVRFWAILYIGGAKMQRVVADGPYSVCRHPLYLGTIMGAAGLGLMFGSLVLAVLVGGLAAAILSAAAAREEQALAGLFGADWTAYAARVPRLIPDPRLYRSPDRITVQVPALRNNLLDAGAFLLTIPLVPLVEAARALGPGVLIALP
jgi:protein-S-isoprenylcysteine O-methyltransferase Ste14